MYELWNDGNVFAVSLTHTSVYNASKIYNFIEERFNNTRPVRHLTIGLANIQNG